MYDVNGREVVVVLDWGTRGGVTSSRGRLLLSVQMSALRERNKIMREGPEREDKAIRCAHTSRLGQHGATSGCCSTAAWTGDKETALQAHQISNLSHYRTPGQVAQVPVKLTGLCFVLDWMQPFDSAGMQSEQMIFIFRRSRRLKLTFYLPSLYLSHLSKE